MKKILISMLTVVLLLTSACGEKVEYGATVGKQKITTSEMKFYLQSVKKQMAGTELSSDEDWQTKEIEGRKAIDLAKDRMLKTAVNNVAYVEVGKAIGIKLSADDKSKVTQNKNQFIAQFATTEAYNEFLKTNNITDKFINMLCESMIYSTLLTEKINTEQPISDEEVSAYYADNKDTLEATYRHAKHVLILTKNMDTGAELSAEEQAAAKQKADEIYQRALKGEDFDSLVSQYSQDPGAKTYPNGYVFGDGEMVPEFQNEVDSLQVGKIGMVKSDYGYHIILKLPIEEKDVADKIKTTMTSDKLSQQMEAWEKEHNITVQVNNEVVATIQ